MKPFLLVSLLSLLGLALAWTPEDHEIFRVRDELTALEGQDISFYEFLGVPVAASLDEINRQYRKKSRLLHPDKAIPSLLAQRSAPKKPSKDKRKKKPGVTVTKGPTAKERAQITKEANERYAHLGVVASILRGPQRERYDHFLRNGFPRWRGTGYYYARLRPGLGSVMVGLLIVFGGAAHYGALYIGWKRQRDFVQRYVVHARTAAWGNESGIPGVPGLGGGAAPVPVQALQQEDDEGGAMPLNRRQKRMQEKESKKKDNSRLAKSARVNGISRPMEPEQISGPQGSKKKVVAPNGKVLIVDSVGNVYLEETTEEGETNEFLLDPEEIPRPTIYQTALFRLPIWLYSQSIGRGVDYYRGTSENAEEPFLDEDGASALGAVVGQQDDDSTLDAVTANTVNGELKKRRAKPRGL